MTYGFWPTRYWPGIPVQFARRDAGFVRVATITAETKRSPVVASGKRGAPATYLAEIEVTPLDPLDPETRQRLALETPHELLQTFVDGGVDVVEGDLLVVDGREYPVRYAAKWLWRGSSFVHLALEDLKR